MSKAQRAAAKQATRENLKKAKRDRLDPDKFTSTLDLLQQRSEASSKTEAKAADASENGNAQVQGNRATTYEELRERLRKRMEELRAKRNADAAAATARKARNWKDEKKKQNARSQKRSIGVAAQHTTTQPAETHKKQKLAHVGGMAENVEKEIGDKNNTFEFGRVKMGLGSEVNGQSKKRRRESKEKLLVKATKLQQQMQDPENGEDVRLKHTWNAALSRSSGEKVYDDPGLLKQSVKREKLKRQKSSKKWGQRKETVNQLIDAKQQTRQEHIKERKQQKLERKMAKREKKLLRPGFEGRRETFINE
ncbi:hypothetical protein KP509_21G078600 [Ceratopteris richardii]|nr:hypothetical protein KP509_21G078600 [Ceratopteris richardii]